jgi:hypothetical protein
MIVCLQGCGVYNEDVRNCCCCCYDIEITTEMRTEMIGCLQGCDGYNEDVCNCCCCCMDRQTSAARSGQTDKRGCTSRLVVRAARSGQTDKRGCTSRLVVRAGPPDLCITRAKGRMHRLGWMLSNVLDLRRIGLRTSG